jgi:hypothetical protein
MLCVGTHIVQYSTRNVFWKSDANTIFPYNPGFARFGCPKNTRQSPEPDLSGKMFPLFFASRAASGLRNLRKLLEQSCRSENKAAPLSILWPALQ